MDCKCEIVFFSGYKVGVHGFENHLVETGLAVNHDMLAFNIGIFNMDVFDSVCSSELLIDCIQLVKVVFDRFEVDTNVGRIVLYIFGLSIC